VLNIYEMGLAPRSRSLSVAGSAAIHLAVLLIVLQVRSPLESRQPRHTATQLYLPPSAPPPAAAPKLWRPLHVPPVVPTTLSLVAPALSALPAKLPAPHPVADLPAPPELSITRAPSAAPRQPGILSPSTAPPAPPFPAFASALTAVAPSAHPVPKAESFASMRVTAVPVIPAKLQGVTGTFGTVPAGTSLRATQPGVTHEAGFGATVPTSHSQDPAAKPKTVGTAFAATVTADPARQPAAARQPVAETLEILFKPRPSYTEEARRAHLEGDVVVEVLFTASGNLRVLQVVRGLGFGLDQNAIDAAAKIRFTPARQDGHPVDTIAMVRISFQMAY